MVNWPIGSKNHSINRGILSLFLLIKNSLSFEKSSHSKLGHIPIRQTHWFLWSTIQQVSTAFLFHSKRATVEYTFVTILEQNCMNSKEYKFLKTLRSIQFLRSTKPNFWSKSERSMKIAFRTKALTNFRRTFYWFFSTIWN